jgi:hypothetical protein
VVYAQQIQEQLVPKLILPNAAEYYLDRYSEQDEDLFIIEKLSWHNIKQNNSSDKTRIHSSNKRLLKKLT